MAGPLEACPLCNARDVEIRGSARGGAWVACPRCGKFETGLRAPLVLESEGDAVCHILSGITRERTVHALEPLLILAENYEELANQGPQTVTDKIDRLLLNLAALSEAPGSAVPYVDERDYTLSHASSEAEGELYFAHLADRGFVEAHPLGGGTRLTVQGWARVDEIGKEHTSLTQGFVAMAAHESLETAYNDAIAPAIAAAGYDPYLVTGVRHVERIDALIMRELNRSRFVVADVTRQRPNVYFEAGYAIGRGTQVIWTCREDDVDNLHFDTRQFRHLLWDDLEEFREELENVIRVVVG